MSNIDYPFSARNSGTFTAGLTPTFTAWIKVSDGSAITPTPTITALGSGLYKYTYDPEASGEAVGIIDLGASLTAATDRYLEVSAVRDSSRIINALDNNGQVNLRSNGWNSAALPTAFAANNLPTFPSNFATLSISGSGAVTVGTLPTTPPAGYGPNTTPVSGLPAMNIPVGFCVPYLKVSNPTGDEIATLKVVALPTNQSGANLARQEQTRQVSLNNNTITFDAVPQGASVQVNCPALGIVWKIVTITATTTMAITG